MQRAQLINILTAMPANLGSVPATTVAGREANSYSLSDTNKHTVARVHKYIQVYKTLKASDDLMNLERLV